MGAGSGPILGSMETATQNAAPGDKPRRVIKRYSNRKLYDTKDSRYVTLQQIGEMVRAGEEVQIIDNATKEDKTEVTLALIISEDLKSQPRSVPLGTLRDLIQERGERLLTQLREGPIGRLIPGAPGEGAAQGTPATEAAPGPAPDASSTEGDKPAGAKARLTEIVEVSKLTLDHWQHAVDERIGAILPVVGQIRELKDEVKRLTQRVDELEAKLAAASSAGGDAPRKGSVK
jgi:polyhydroxyalkanoate synthesis repressor PhaR